MLTARGVRLRLLDAGDRDLYRALYTSPDVMRAIAPPLATEAADAQFERVVRHNSAKLPGHRAWAIEVPAREAPVGLTVLLRTGSGAEYGSMLLPQAQGQKIASDSLAVLLRYAFATLQLEWVYAGSRLDLDGLFLPFGFRRLAACEGTGNGWLLRGADFMSSPPAGQDDEAVRSMHGERLPCPR